MERLSKDCVQALSAETSAQGLKTLQEGICELRDIAGAKQAAEKLLFPGLFSFQ